MTDDVGLTDCAGMAAQCAGVMECAGLTGSVGRTQCGTDGLCVCGKDTVRD